MPDQDLAATEHDDFAPFLDEVEALLVELGRPGLISSPRDVERLMKLFDAGAPIDVVLRGIETGARRRLAGGKEVSGLGDLMPAVRAELRRAGVVGGPP